LIENGAAGTVTLTANANAASQNVYIQNAVGITGGVTLSGASSAGSSGTFSLTSVGNIASANSGSYINLLLFY
jgi:hypothetical protein